MKIYLDLVLFLNFSFDFLLLLGVSTLLRRNASIWRLLLASLIGSLSILFLFVPMNAFQLFFMKVVISVIMIISAFGYKDLRYTGRNLFYLYTASFILGGFLYYLNAEFSYKQEGLIFYHHGLSINVIVLLILSPLILYTYVKQGIRLKNNYANYYAVVLYLKGLKPITLHGFLDTGNHLLDPYLKRPVILLDKRYLPGDVTLQKTIMVPFHSAAGGGLLTCIIPEKIEIQGLGVRRNFLVGLTEDKFHIDGVDCILNIKLMEGKNYV